MWRELITEKSIDLTFIKKLSEQLVTRKDLWKYYEVTTQHVKDWKNWPIKKLNIKKIEEKVLHWEIKIEDFKKIIGEEDKVLINWKSILDSFKFSLKWISKLGSSTFRNEEFQELFSAIGIEYDIKKSYTIQDLIDLKLDEFTDLIDIIYKKSFTEINQIQKFDHIKELWNNKLKFKLAKNFPIKLYQTEKFNLASAANTSSSLDANIVSTSKLRELRDLSSKQIEESNALMTNVTYKLIDLNEIRYLYDVTYFKFQLYIIFLFVCLLFSLNLGFNN